MGNSRYQMMGSNVGLQTATLAIGGYDPGGSMTEVESYDGTNWTATTVLPTGQGNSARYGIQTAAVAVGNSPSSTLSLQFDGTTWTATPSLAQNRDSNSGSGTTTAGVIGGGSVGPTAKSEVEEYNGTSWSEETNITTARYGLMGAGTLAAGVVFVAILPII